MKRLLIVAATLAVLFSVATERADAQAASTGTVLYNFTGTRNSPVAGGIMDSVGNLYGTTAGGGSAGLGTVFKIDSTGHETVLYAFTGANGDGANPNAGLVMDNAGNLYGTTGYGGNTAGPCVPHGYIGGCGIIFRLDPTGHVTVLYSFTGANGDGAYPFSGLMMNSAGNLYGTTSGGGLYSHGTVFRLDSTDHETVLHSFGGAAGLGGQPDGTNPQTALIEDSAGNLYGTTTQGSANVAAANACNSLGCGTVFRLDTSGHETVLYSFTGATGDGANPYSRLTIDGAGNLYGTTLYGGQSGNAAGPCNTLGCGIVFKVDTSGHETVLYTFTGANGDGANPNAGLVMDSAGSLYGTANGFAGNGGIIPPSGGQGIIFKLNSAGQETVLYTFNGAGGGSPNSDLIRDSAGNLYGSSLNGGAANGGTMFKLDATGHETVLYSFDYTNNDGAHPAAALVMDSSGNLYGTTLAGGRASGPCLSNLLAQFDGCGTVFELEQFHK